MRYLRVAAKNPLVMSDSERAQVSHAFGQLVARVPAGQSLQFYVEAARCKLDALLEHSRREVDRALALDERAAMRSCASARASAAAPARARWSESLELHCDEQAAVELGYYVVVPLVPDQGLRVDWRSLLPGRRRGLRRAPLSRGARVAPPGGARVAAADRRDPGRSGGARPVDPAAVRARRWPTCCGAVQPDHRRPHARAPPRRPASRGSRCSASSTPSSDAPRGGAGGAALRELVAGSAHTVDGQRQLRVDRDLEQTHLRRHAAGRDLLRLAAGGDGGARGRSR